MIDYTTTWQHVADFLFLFAIVVVVLDAYDESTEYKTIFTSTSTYHECCVSLIIVMKCKCIVVIVEMININE